MIGWFLLGVAFTILVQLGYWAVRRASSSHTEPPPPRSAAQRANERSFDRMRASRAKASSARFERRVRRGKSPWEEQDNPFSY